ncbi:MAG: phosphoribosylamine--glycine ligase [Eubacteriales bacterium]|nr:phosphoribosylamine--glycine ligase [Eubacteriales bacterium]MDD3880922.1 phosphoribosylamine--glycine ligase [Eubacteriales bacterium]MDD4511711.1 phosphoribosylamine--glycine ligase [Eubacteriales bacterium]
MKVLVVGGGGREHAIVKALRESNEIDELICAPGNGGISVDCRCVPEVGASDIDAIVSLAKAEKVDYVVVGPDDPLALGCVDRLTESGIPAFGPDKSAARMESSKIFSKGLMEKHSIPTAKFRTFTDYENALRYIETQQPPLVVKADGLALGKGAIICETLDDAREAVKEMMLDGKFGKSGAFVLIEECIYGPEITVLCFCDGKSIVPMVSSQDHKRALDGDKGLNTGGMGAVAPCPLYTPEIAARVEAEVLKPVMDAMIAEGLCFKGILYVQLMLTKDGPKVIEFNARFGDPEAQVVIPLLKTDLFTIMRACTDGTLGKLRIEWKNECAATVVLASGGYPEHYEKGKYISGLSIAMLSGATIYHAGTKRDKYTFLTNGGRVLDITARGATLEQALQKAYSAVRLISFDGMQYRTDIGKKYRA